jgi:hypothetical protein
MGNSLKPDPVKLFAGFIFSDTEVFDKAVSSLSKRLGAIETLSDTYVFDQTSYYKKEMGEGLKRRFVSFKGARKLCGIERVKRVTNKLEDSFRATGNRRINIDPGYIEPGKVVLLTTKDYIHRIHLGSGIYAEVTLYYKDKRYRPWEWTYPDYKTKEYIEYFEKVRATLTKG